ncbi:tRNA (N(6)-L-threonylcarbamoyladenosine(37)-C(2))-methylthiotransferase MtaB [Lutispora sp.]|uniref:tRNA (N(6)-L-threonylcarbamoyladenosine(37)-C(2))- methylthiotransferase MtaB n=1 Tax=Lutispora sp. TaxID=2828727 RepID=UPI002B2140C1|nr:tRNA (N(6)-L-threonylcarbamoyladenosine(37)-C(2))-methylthiotransferase MtaB [Lutispora sp.]MEA4960349.1 tRNA (N(6)-L-threonylcarbamoyladenosine(37)-C(2))-methylthiotransferase MtaB [Lutispora sp.]
MNKVAFYTLGCKVNQYETEAMIEAFENAGYEIVEYDGYSDIYIINTCTVTNMGDRKSRQIIRRALEYNPKAFIAVVGCYSQIAPDEILGIDGVRLVLGTNERSKIVQLVEDAQNVEDKISVVGDIMEIEEFEDMNIKHYKSRSRAFIKIQEGCEQYCTYCIIPYARGHIRSRKPDSIIEEVKILADSGYKEVVLTGIHVGSYGRDLGDIGLIDIIQMVHDVDGIERLRMSSVEPKTFDDDFLRRLPHLNKLCRHFHLSLQSGCDETLKRMNRKYTTQEYMEVVKKLRSIYPEVGITTDIIVGFPGETQEEFEKTVQFVKEVSFSSMHIFKFSPRKGTPAAKFKGQVSAQVKEERSKIIFNIAKENQMKFMNSFIGKSLNVLFEQKIDENSNYYEGLTDNYIRVMAETAYDIKGKIISTKIKGINKDMMLGILEKI